MGLACRKKISRKRRKVEKKERKMPGANHTARHGIRREEKIYRNRKRGKPRGIRWMG